MEDVIFDLGLTF